jgi:hypothetical protein
VLWNAYPLFHEYDRAGHRHMEYVRELGHYADVPYETIVAAFRQAHPRWLAHRTVAAAGDFASEAAAAD